MEEIRGEDRNFWRHRPETPKRTTQEDILSNGGGSHGQDLGFLLLRTRVPDAAPAAPGEQVFDPEEKISC